MGSLRTVQNSPSAAQDVIELPAEMPDIPEDVVARFDSMGDYDAQLQAWWQEVNQAITNSSGSISAVTNNTFVNTNNLTASFGQFKAQITTEIATIVNQQGAQATEIVTVSAMAGVNSNISVQSTAPSGPALNDYWINTSLTPAATFQWNGATWVAVTTPIAFAGVATEQTARVTADGFLSGKYTLTVIAGNVVTGFNITSSTGSGTNISNVSFTTGAFQIYDGSSTSYPVFSASAGVITLASTLIVNTSGKVFIGTGTYGNNNTPFYVDSTGKFSLGANLTWTPSTLTITGVINSTSGTIGGWTIGTTALTGTNITLSSTGSVTVTDSNSNSGIFSTAGLILTSHRSSINAADISVQGTVLTVPQVDAGQLQLLAKLGSGGSQSAGTYGFTVSFGASATNNYWSMGSDGILGINSGGALSATFNGAAAAFTGSVTVATTLGVTGAVTLSSTLGVSALATIASLSVTGSAGVGGLFAVTGAVTFSSTLGVTGSVTASQMIALSGSTSALSYTFFSDSTTGFYYSSANHLAVQVGGTASFVFENTKNVTLIPFKLDNAFVAGAPTATGYLTMQDSGGTTYKFLVGT